MLCRDALLKVMYYIIYIYIHQIMDFISVRSAMKNNVSTNSVAGITLRGAFLQVRMSNYITRKYILFVSLKKFSDLKMKC